MGALSANRVDMNSLAVCGFDYFIVRALDFCLRRHLTLRYAQYGMFSIDKFPFFGSAERLAVQEWRGAFTADLRTGFGAALPSVRELGSPPRLQQGAEVNEHGASPGSLADEEEYVNCQEMAATLRRLVDKLPPGMVSNPCRLCWQRPRCRRSRTSTAPLTDALLRHLFRNNAGRMLSP